MPKIEYGYTTDAEQDRIIELIGSYSPYDDTMDTIHEIANIENSIYDDVLKNILSNSKRRFLSKFSRKELKSIRGEAKNEKERIIMNIKAEYKRRKQLEQDMQVLKRVKELQSQVVF